MSDILVELLGIIAGTLGVIAWVPQLNEVWKQKKHEGISLSTLYLICTALLLWLIYGVIRFNRYNSLKSRSIILYSDNNFWSE